MPERITVADLRDRMGRIAEGAGGGSDGAVPRGARAVAAMGIPAIDGAIGGGLEVGAIHEFIGHTDGGADRVWSPPVGLVAHVARWVSGGMWVVWIGAEVWPSGQTVAAMAGVVERSVFVDARTPADRVWSADVALRHGGAGGVGCVVVDGQRFAMAATRRLQLAARSTGAVGILARPPGESRAVSVASSRWVVRRRAAEGGECAMDPGWIVACVRCKGVRPVQGARWTWAVEWCCATSDVGVVADVVDRPCAPEADAGGRLAATA